MHRWPTYGKLLDTENLTMHIHLYTVYSSQYRGKWSRWRTGTVHNLIDENGLKCSKGPVATRNFNLQSILVEKG